MIALPIAPRSTPIYYTYTFTDASKNMMLEPGSDLSITGFPFGTSSDGRFAIWSRATVASDPDINYLNRPTFLVDSRNREGQSGSPVVLKASGSIQYENGSVVMMTGSEVQLFGIYSGRISPESDLGIVWKAAAIRELVEGRQRSSRLLDE